MNGGPAADRSIAANEDAMTLSSLKLSLILFGLARLLEFKAWRHPAFRARLKERNLVAQIMTRDEEIGRWFEFNNGQVRSRAGLHAKPGPAPGQRGAGVIDPAWSGSRPGRCRQAFRRPCCPWPRRAG